jgi:DNA-binding transcriptional regulator YhcF (GntR family)
MKFSIDRDLPIAVRAQLHGVIEYAIAYGGLAPGDPLPSVRELAEQVGVAPMTVSEVYAKLKEQGLVQTRPGRGTFVADSRRSRMAARPEIAALHRRIDALIDEGTAIGLRMSELASLINGRLQHRVSLGRRTSVVMVGLFPEATASYARFIAARLGSEVDVEDVTVDTIQKDPDVRARANAADLVITLPTRQREVASLLVGARVVAVGFLPSEETRRALASLDPMLKITLVSLFPEFLPTLRAGVLRFASHVARVEAACLHGSDLETLLNTSDAVVYSTGAEAILSRIGDAKLAIEYRHAPDPIDIEQVVVPILRQLATSADAE